MIPKLVLLGVGAVLLVGLLLVVTLLAVYRPSIGFAYVDVLSVGEPQGPAFWVVGLWLLAVVGSAAALARLWRKRRGAKGGAGPVSGG